VSLPLEHDVVVVEQRGEFVVRRALGGGLKTRHDEAAAVASASREEAIAVGEKLAEQNRVDLWVVDANQAKRLTSHRPRRTSSAS
jgi:hypothetical protein